MQMMDSACLSKGQIFKSHICKLPLSMHFRRFTKKRFLHLAVIEGVGVVSVARVLLVTVEAVIVRLVQEVSSRGGQTLDSVGVLLVLVILKYDRRCTDVSFSFN